MNPFTVARKALIIVSRTLKALLLLTLLFGAGLIAQQYWGPWGWALGPVLIVSVMVALALFVNGAVRAIFAVQNRWGTWEREYRG